MAHQQDSSGDHGDKHGPCTTHRSTVGTSMTVG
eukprot:CAMPEP_0115127428 /NCGR_PEP_ID=MMETSP0227-20121206/50378_1 /TAXON_ID=89957 /ORGANISM="Polarella glacialis, Strain CCMP 1383" /LENGTH=32 /DNA_ID= /DNA_START= /DNA_END= /DNA_ORIENTATION=